MRPLKGRLLELYTGECPPERPCRPEDVAAFQAMLKPRKLWIIQEWIRPWIHGLRSTFGRCWRFSTALLCHILSGLPHATAEQQASRRAICNGCPQFDLEKDECKECGCKLGAVEKKGMKKLMRKTLWARESCPLWRLTGPRSACQPAPPEGGWGPVEGISIVQRLLRRWLYFDGSATGVNSDSAMAKDSGHNE